MAEWFDAPMPIPVQYSFRSTRTTIFQYTDHDPKPLLQSFSASIEDGHDVRGFPLRRPYVRPLSDAPLDDIKHWFHSCGVQIRPLLHKDSPLFERYLRVLYTYRHLDAQCQADIPATDLYVHRVRLTEGTKPFRSTRKIRRTY